MSTSTALLVLTAASVNLELALLVRTLANGVSALETGTLLLAFHSGYLLADRLTNRRPVHLATAAVVGLCGATLGLLAGSIILSSVFILMSSAALQAIRRQLKAHARPRAAMKNVAKFVAMTVAGVAVTNEGLVVLSGSWLFGVLLGAAAARPRPLSVSQASVGSPHRAARWLRLTELLHHAHYFAYCYVFWRLIPDLPVRWVGIFFSAGWLAYFAAESINSRTRAFSPVFIAGGHVLCAACLVAMTAVTSATSIVVLWFLTGIGGGTAYMLANGPTAPGREHAEDTGHAVGTIVGAAVATWLNAEASLLTAALVALATSYTSIMVHLEIAPSRRRSVCES